MSPWLTRIDENFTAGAMPALQTLDFGLWTLDFSEQN